MYLCSAIIDDLGVCTDGLAYQHSSYTTVPTVTMDPRDREAREAIEQRKKELLDRAYDRVVLPQLNKISSQKTYTEDDEEAYRQQNASDREKAVNRKRKALTAEHEELARTTGLSGHVVALMASGGQEDGDDDSSGNDRDRKHSKKKKKSKKKHKKKGKKRSKERRRDRSGSHCSMSSDSYASEEEDRDRKKHTRSTHLDSDSSSDYRREKKTSKRRKSRDSQRSPH